MNTCATHAHSPEGMHTAVGCGPVACRCGVYGPALEVAKHRIAALEQQQMQLNSDLKRRSAELGQLKVCVCVCVSERERESVYFCLCAPSCVCLIKSED